VIFESLYLTTYRDNAVQWDI